MNQSTTEQEAEAAEDAAGERAVRAASPPRKVLFVCTGNTCRSPMAEGIARQLARKRGWQALEVRSAGAAAFPGSPTSGGAVRAAARDGIDLTSHRSTLLTRREVEWADLILAMSPSHLERIAELGGGAHAALLTAYATAADPAREASAIPDPIGGSDAEYRATFERLAELVDRALERLVRGTGGR